MFLLLCEPHPCTVDLGGLSKAGGGREGGSGRGWGVWEVSSLPAYLGAGDLEV